MNNDPLILVIDDEQPILKSLNDILSDEGYQVETLNDGNKSIDLIGKLIPDLVLLDIFMPNCNGIKTLEQIKKEYPNINVIMISGFGNISIAIECLKKGALDFIEKPLNLDEILTKIKFLNNKKNIDQTNLNLENSSINTNPKIIGQSYLFLELVQQINQIKDLLYPLLIYGEHGTGKSLFVEYLHKNSIFKNADLITINCSSFNNKEITDIINNFYKTKDPHPASVIPDLIRDPVLNNNSILYIKHINKLSPENQNLLLKYLEQNKNSQKKLIASSLEDLYFLVKNNLFNGALFHLLNITPIEVPSLNKRRYDIPLLCDYFLKENNNTNNKSIIFDTKAIRILRNHDWTGNVTELKNLISYIVKATKENDKIIDDLDLTKYIEEKKLDFIEEQTFTKFNSLKEATNSFEKKYLFYLLKKNMYDIKQTANILNMSVIQLKEKIQKLNLVIKS
ncbi:response regulator [Candidatus Dependentiae bacterium]|nr:response regulator [Candidatus Dependentiae bacterium]MBU4387664.1 response regulator [Candidatus Dependentiae bacterium]MCG2756051.1 response regulator [Candidatus Dependentiae bacterium]